MLPTSALSKFLSYRTSLGNFDLVLAGPIMKISRYITYIELPTELV